jgi:Uma2 family endonuclease
MSPAVQNAPEPAIAKTPPLENGDRLTRAEFERRYEAMPHVKKAELIEGVVYMPSPARMKQHGAPQTILVTWLGHYAAHTRGVQAGDNATVRLDLDNEPQPDAILRILPEAGGQTSDSPDDFVEGAPEFAAEIASSSASYDLHQKKNAYRRNRVREYLVWVTGERRIHWWELRDEAYQPLEPDADGIIKSRVFPGLWLDLPGAAAKRFRASVASRGPGRGFARARKFRGAVEQAAANRLSRIDPAGTATGREWGELPRIFLLRTKPVDNPGQLSYCHRTDRKNHAADAQF